MFLPSSADCRIIAATHTRSCGDMDAAVCCSAYEAAGISAAAAGAQQKQQLQQRLKLSWWMS
jgi:hypothetical protein